MCVCESVYGFGYDMDIKLKSNLKSINIVACKTLDVILHTGSEYVCRSYNIRSCLKKMIFSLSGLQAVLIHTEKKTRDEPPLCTLDFFVNFNIYRCLQNINCDLCSPKTEKPFLSVHTM